MKITAIKAQVRNQERVSIYLDGKYSFSLTQSQLLEHKLFSGKELSEHELAQLKYASDYGKTLERVMNFVMIRPRSTREVRDYLWRKKAAPELAESIINRLQERNYLDDANFAKSWVRARQLTKPVSRRRLSAELREKGVANELIEQAVGHEAYDETEALRQIVTKKRKQARYQDEQKLIAYLARQGFGYDTIKQALHENPDAAD
jgi:regulatory protein